jgi:2-polyprenyl-6-methoxyphenol hydroxylase-like FAD-dependent oxidoreductase
MKEANPKPILVAGGGIGGLAVALGLAKVGAKVVVLEKAAQFGEIGAGFELAPNAMHALDYLGMGEAARDAGVYVDRLVFMDAMSGEEIYSVPVRSEQFIGRFGNPWVTTHRNDLHNVMLKAAQKINLIQLVTNSEVMGFDQDSDSVSARLSTGERVVGRALVAADGVRSNLRSQMIGDEIRLHGHTAYRASIPGHKLPSDMEWLSSTTTLWGGPKCHIITYPLSGTKLINLVLVSSDEKYAYPKITPGQSMPAEEVYSRFDFTHKRVKCVYTLADDFKVWEVGDRDPISKWVDGRVLLLGDAAHAMLQYMAQGACQALEDAMCLSKEFDAASGNIEKTLSNYQSKRVLRAARVQIMSRAAGEHIWHPSGTHAAVRSDILRNMPIKEFYDRMDWLWGGDKTVSAPVERHSAR